MMNFKTLIVISLLLRFSSACNTKKTIHCNTPDAVTYTTHVAPLIEAKCFMCHAPDVYKTKASRNKIIDYASLKKMGESGQLIGSITHQTGFVAMPYRKGEKIDSCAIVLLKKWVATGMIE